MKTFFRKNFIKKKPLRKASAKAQSAMEYLMTYGWAILIISVVLAALFQLGVFNPMTFAPKAPPGSCQVFRPNGPYTTSFINLEGVCSGELPQYVAQFNGQSSYVSLSNVPSLNPSTLTIAGWFNINTFSPSEQGFVDKEGQYGVYVWSNRIEFDLSFSWNGKQVGYATINPNTWYFVSATFDGTNQNIYLNGNLLATYNLPGTITQNTNNIGIGMGGNFNSGLALNGKISNVQIYNTSLSANDIQALYLEGIGGAPINLQHLIGWWPLNGNANDYSGNGNNGQINNVNFVSNWYNGYTPP